MGKRTRYFVVLFAALALVAAACGDDDQPAQTAAPTPCAHDRGTDDRLLHRLAPTTAAPTTDGVLKIGVLLPQTGGLSVIISALQKPIEMLDAEIAAAGGEVELVFADSGTDPSVGSVAVDDLLNEGVDAIVGPAFIHRVGRGDRQDHRQPGRHVLRFEHRCAVHYLPRQRLLLPDRTVGRPPGPGARRLHHG